MSEFTEALYVLSLTTHGIASTAVLRSGRDGEASPAQSGLCTYRIYLHIYSTHLHLYQPINLAVCLSPSSQPHPISFSQIPTFPAFPSLFPFLSPFPNPTPHHITPLRSRPISKVKKPVRYCTHTGRSQALAGRLGDFLSRALACSFVHGASIRLGSFTATG